MLVVWATQRNVCNFAFPVILYNAISLWYGVNLLVICFLIFIGKAAREKGKEATSEKGEQTEFKVILKPMFVMLCCLYFIHWIKFCIVDQPLDICFSPHYWHNHLSFFLLDFPRSYYHSHLVSDLSHLEELLH